MEIRINKDKVRDTAWGLVASGLFSGFCPVWPSAAGSILGAAFWWLIRPGSVSLQLLSVVFIFILGWFAAKKAEDWWGQDDRRIVVDEMAGIWLTLWTFERNPWIFLIGLVFFLFINLVKFYPAFVCHRFGLGWGVMMEKAVVGAYTGILLTVASLFFSSFPTYGLLLARAGVYLTVIAAATACHVYGSNRGGLAIISIALSCLLFWLLAPANPWTQLIILLISVACLSAALRFLAGIPWVMAMSDYALLAWGCWASLWFLPKAGLIILIGAILMAFFRHIRPFPTNYLPNWGLEASMILPNAIAAIYTGALLQVGIMLFGESDRGFIKYAVISILRLFNIRG